MAENLITTPTHPAAELVARFGAEDAETSGGWFWVTRDVKGKAVMGPRRHRMKEGWWRVTKHAHTKQTIAQRTEADPEATIVITPSRHEPVAHLGTWRKGLADRFHNVAWHKSVQHTAVDVMAWSVAVGLSAVVLKAAWWVVTL